MKMKKLLSIALAATMTFTPVTAFAIDVRIDNAPLAAEAVSINGRTMVPMRAIFEALGATVAWNEATQSITAVKGTDTINLFLNKTTAYINGNTTAMSAAPVSVNGRTMVPARFVAEAMGCTVGWDEATQTVNITTNGVEQPVKANTYDVIRVVDGDTFVVDFNGTEEKVRLIGIDTPESVHPDADKNTAAGVTASDYTKALLTGKSVELEFDVQERDKYGRLLAYAYLDGYMLNKKLLEDGYAVVSTYPPNVKYVDEFTAAAKYDSVFDEVSSEPFKNTTTNSNGNIAEATYIGNANTKKSHDPSCSSVKKMSEKNKVSLPDRETAVSQGYEPCGNCKP